MGGGRLSSPIEDIQDHYTVVVVGSGYGGGIAASRLARAGQSVCLLERGKERVPGEFPQTSLEALEEFQIVTPSKRENPSGLYEIRFFDDINVVIGCGLGGTSLINANVSIEPSAWVFEDERWPAALRADVANGVKAGFERAFEMLKPTPLPDTKKLAKLEAQQASAAQMNAELHRCKLNVTVNELTDDTNHVGVKQR